MVRLEPADGVLRARDCARSVVVGEIRGQRVTNERHANVLGGIAADEQQIGAQALHDLTATVEAELASWHGSRRRQRSTRSPRRIVRPGNIGLESTPSRPMSVSASMNTSGRTSDGRRILASGSSGSINHNSPTPIAA